MSKPTFAGAFAAAERDPAYWKERAVLSATEEIALAMERAGVSRAELARRLGSSPAYVTKILRGNANFTLDSLSRLARALGGELKVQILPPQERCARLQPGLPPVARRTPALPARGA